MTTLTEWCRQNLGQCYISWPYDDEGEGGGGGPEAGDGASSVSAAAGVLLALALAHGLVIAILG